MAIAEVHAEARASKPAITLDQEVLDALYRAGGSLTYDGICKSLVDQRYAQANWKCRAFVWRSNPFADLFYGPSYWHLSATVRKLEVQGKLIFRERPDYTYTLPGIPDYA
jgi:hypothetical protein